MNLNIFRAYDIRANYPSEINEDVAYTIGLAYGSYLREFLDKNKCVVSLDNRLSGPSLKEYLVKGLLESGINVCDYGVTTTPMHYYARHIENTYGIMITASHNPKDDNGFKFSFDHVSNARGKMIEDFKEYVLNGNFLTGKGTLEKRNIKNLYLKYMLDNVNLGERKLKVVFDMGNGVTTTIIKDIIKLFPTIEPIYICDISDGTFPFHHPDPAVIENMAMLKDKVLETKADLGIAFDGDGDRLGIISNSGKFIMADELMIVAVRNLIKTVTKKTFLCDVKCSKSFIDEVEKLGGNIYMSRTGTSFTQANTKENNIPFGGELSGHIFFNDRGIEICSAIYDGLRFIEILSKCDKTFDELLEDIPVYYSTPEIKVAVNDNQKFDVVENLKEYFNNNNIDYLDIDGIRFSIKDAWGLIRASNTGPNLTLRFEAKTKELLEQIKKEFMDLVLSTIS